MYLLDSNTYIQAKNLQYDMDFCPAYWDWLDYQYEKGMVASISSVYDELVQKGDSLSNWVKDRKSHFLPVTATDIQHKMSDVAEYVANQDQKDAANISNFLSGADPWLIASAIVKNGTIVTYERLAGNESKRVKIPNVCEHFNVPYMNAYDLLRALNARFVLDRN